MNAAHLLREFLWLSDGDTERLRVGLFEGKWGYKARREAEVLAPLVIGVVLAFLQGVGWGFAYLWLCKFALQAMIRKGFFDP